jgi:transcriptional regulator with XRE-family HTH domain
MTTIKRKHNIIQRLKDKAQRDAYVEAQVDIGIPFQIRALREQREETQAELSSRTGWAQAWVSKLENPNYKGFSLATLKKVASAFEVGLMVRFVPISELVKWELNLSQSSLRVANFDEDPFFNEEELNSVTLSKLATATQRTTSTVVSMADYLRPTDKEDTLSKLAGEVL